MTFKEIIEAIIGDIDEDIYDTTLVNKISRYVNRGYKELAKRERLEKKLTTNIVDGIINMPLDSIKVYEVLNDGLPIGFSMNGKDIVCNATGKADVIYSYIPEKLANDTDIPKTNIANEEFILFYVKWLYFLSDDQVELAKLYKEEYESFKVITQNKNFNIIDVYGVI